MNFIEYFLLSIVVTNGRIILRKSVFYAGVILSGCRYSERVDIIILFIINDLR